MQPILSNFTNNSQLADDSIQSHKEDTSTSTSIKKVMSPISVHKDDDVSNSVHNDVSDIFEDYSLWKLPLSDQMRTALLAKGGPSALQHINGPFVAKHRDLRSSNKNDVKIMS